MFLSEPAELKPAETSFAAYWIFATPAVVLATAAFVSLIQAGFEIPATPILQAFLDSYRAAVHPPLDWLLSQARSLAHPWELPSLATADVYALSYAGGMLFAAWSSSGIARRANGVWRAVLQTALALVTGATFLGLAAIFLVGEGLFSSRHDADDGPIFLPVLIAVAFTAVVFVANAIGIELGDRIG